MWGCCSSLRGQMVSVLDFHTRGPGSIPCINKVFSLRLLIVLFQLQVCDGRGFGWEGKDWVLRLGWSIFGGRSICWWFFFQTNIKREFNKPIIKEEFFSSLYGTFSEDSNSMISIHHHYFGVTVWVYRVICKADLISFPGCIHYKICKIYINHLNSYANHQVQLPYSCV